MSPQATFCATLVDEWVRAGARHAVVSPGSRSTPLVLALAAREELTLHVVLDERSAGFVALGLGRATGGPAILVCTSGTAALNHHPAVVEAELAAVPLLVCTADRPPDLHEVGAPQTIEQVGLYGRSPRWSLDLDPLALPPLSWRSIGSRAVAEATAGPVHLNVRLREPFLEEDGPLPAGRDAGAPWHRNATAPLRWEPDTELLGRLDGRRLLVVAGEGADDGGTAWLEQAPWPVLADPLSGLRRPAPGVVCAFDQIVRAAPAELAPDVVLHLGRPPASKALTQWIDEISAEHVVVERGRGWSDPGRRAGLRLQASPGPVAAALAARTSPPKDHREAWTEAEAAAQEAIDSVLAGHPEVTEPAVARTLTAVLRPGAQLFVSSSMPIRDVEWFGVPREGLRVRANRGANGIDGITSTALGVALGAPGRHTVALLGDLAFLHDAAALNGLRSRRCSLTLVVVDNRGGGIFSFLPQASFLARERFEELFGTPHDVDLTALLAAHRIPCAEVEAQRQLEPLLEEAATAGGVRALVARTDRTANVAVHRDIAAAVADRMGA